MACIHFNGRMVLREAPKRKIKKKKQETTTLSLLGIKPPERCTTLAVLRQPLFIPQNERGVK